jgi:hypothetical protein
VPQTGYLDERDDAARRVCGVADGSPGAYAQATAAGGQGAGDAQRRGRSDPAFTQPSLAPGVDYTVPSEAEIKQVLDRIRDNFERATPYRVIDTTTGQTLAELGVLSKTAGIDTRASEFND